MPALDSLLPPDDRLLMLIDHERRLSSTVASGRRNRPASRWHRQAPRTELIGDRLGETCGNQAL